MLIAIFAFALLSLAGTGRGIASRITAIVNGAVITDFDISQRQRLERLLSGGKSRSGTTATLNSLIEEKIKLFEARARNMTASDQEIDNALENMARNAKLTKSKMFGIFKRAGINDETLKDWLRVQLSWKNLVNARFNTTTRVDEADIYRLLSKESESEKNKADDAIQFDITRVLFIARAKASSQEKNRRLSEAKRFRAAFKSCESDLASARRLKDVVVEHIGRKMTTDLHPALAKRLRETPINGLTTPVTVDDGYELIAICGKKDLGKQETLRNEIATKLKDEQTRRLARQYLSELKARAIIEKR